MENVEFLAAAFAVFWGITFAYVFSIGRRQTSLEQDLKVLEDLLGKEDEA